MLATRRVVKALLATWMVVNKASFQQAVRRRVARHVVAKREWERLFSGERLGWLAERCSPGAPGRRSASPRHARPGRCTDVPRGRRQHARAAVCRQPPRTRAVATRRATVASSARRARRAGRRRRAVAGLSPATAAPLPCLRRLLRPPEVRSRGGPARTRRVRGSRAWSGGGAGCTSPRCTRRSPSAPRPWWPTCVGRSAPS